VTRAPAAGRVTGVVVDERGFPVAGARVTVDGAGFHGGATTDKRGEFRVDGLPDGVLALAAAHPEHPTARLPHVAAGDDLRVQLAPGGGVEGEARDRVSGAAPPGLVVVVESGGEKREASIERRGHFRAVGCPPGAATLRATAPGYLAASLAVEIPAGEFAHDVTLRDLRLELELGGEVVGTVRDARGDPASGVEVTAPGARARTDAGGRFRLGPLAPGRVEVRAGGAVEEAIVEAGRPSPVEIRLR
jgi:hypothetical protein